MLRSKVNSLGNPYSETTHVRIDAHLFNVRLSVQVCSWLHGRVVSIDGTDRHTDGRLAAWRSG